MKTKSVLAIFLLLTITAMADVTHKVGDAAHVMGYVVQTQGEATIFEKTKNGGVYFAVKNAPSGLTAGKHFAGEGTYIGVLDWKTANTGNTTPIPYWAVKSK